ncbi:hypothetical protein BV898_14596 [Hypsibius exemplaris]|uniref:Uncharacterized protein n=1 Tax=Hypsibius exemplaris TaxID=2072580 RepID=A0A9X6NAW7_HYPEX|nr:hypothetical protein BV898_14596 [Hypsibius exemplaris]
MAKGAGVFLLFCGPVIVHGQAIGFLPGAGATLDSGYYPQADTSNQNNGVSSVYFYNGNYYSGTRNNGGGGGYYGNSNNNNGNGNLVCYNGACFDSTNTAMGGALPGDPYCVNGDCVRGNGGAQTFCSGGNCYQYNSGAWRYTNRGRRR